ncbi:hypothetical protein [Streptomyces sp. NPDC047079]|uniref:hypothetical protein n=1 Tax=Streptomyces sp. NPDC047079 TaxID=3154607 RepID=UPI00340764E7
MDRDSVLRRALDSFDRLPGDERQLIEALIVHEWFGAAIIEYTSAALGLTVTTAQVAASPVVSGDPVPHVSPDQEARYIIRPFLRSGLLERLRSERSSVYRQAHRLAATYFHQPLEPLQSDRLDWYVKEVRHLAAVRPETAFMRLSSFAHSALTCGYTEAAGRAATAAVGAGVPLRPDAVSLARTIKALAEILNAPAHVEHSAVMALDDLIVQQRPPTDPAASRILMLARDLVAYYTERLAPVAPLTAQVAPNALTTADARGLPASWNALRMFEDLAHMSATISTRTHRVHFQDLVGAHQKISTKLSPQLAAGNHPQQSSPVIVDVLPWEADRFLDKLHLSERNGPRLPMLTSTDVKRLFAKGVHQLLDSDDSAATGSASRGELVRQLDAAAWSGQADEITAAMQRAAEAEDVDPHLRGRIAEMTRYMPVVALIDTHPGISSEVTYEFDRSGDTKRLGWGVIEVAVVLDFLSHVRRTHLEVVTPHGLIPAGEPTVESDWPGVSLRPESAEEEGVQEFSVDIPRRDDEQGWPTSDRITMVRVQMTYVLSKKDFNNVLRISGLCMLISAAGLFLPFVLAPSLWSQLASIAASLYVVIDSLMRGPKRDVGHEAGGEKLRVYANKPLNIVLLSNVVAAIIVAAAANIEYGVGQYLAGFALFVCAASFVAVWTALAHRRRFIPLEGRRRGLRTLVP